MPWYRMPDGSPYHINYGGKRNLTAPRACCGPREDGTQCGLISGYQCDWKLAGGKTCRASGGVPTVARRAGRY